MCSGSFEDCGKDDYVKVDTDILFLIDRLKILKNKIGDTRWYNFFEIIKLMREFKKLEEELEDIGERIQRLRLHNKKINPIQFVKRV